MWRVKLGAPRGTATRWAGLLTLSLVLSLSACGGDTTPTPETITTDAGEVGESLESGGWTVTLVAPPELTKQLGSGAAGEMTVDSDDGYGRAGVRIAEGMWLILTVEVTNSTGDLAMLRKDLLKVADAQGGEYAHAGITVHAPLINADERWEGQEKNQLVHWVFHTGNARQGPMVFDVLEDATGLRLVMEGTDETIDLGF